jgi:hypothetical protein
MLKRMGWVMWLLFPSLMFGAQYPNLQPLSPPVAPRPQTDHRLPIDGPQQTGTANHQPQLDHSQLKRQADELTELAQSVPAGIEKVSTGQLPKDLITRLKKIEKLSKQLQRELAP